MPPEISEPKVYEVKNQHGLFLRYELALPIPPVAPADVAALIEPYRASLAATLKDHPQTRRHAVLEEQARALRQKYDQARQRLDQLKAERTQALAIAGADLADTLDALETAIAETEVKLPRLKESSRDIEQMASGAQRDFQFDFQQASMRVGQEARQLFDAEALMLADQLLTLPGVAPLLARIGTLHAAIKNIMYRNQHETGVQETLTRPAVAPAEKIEAAAALVT